MLCLGSHANYKTVTLLGERIWLKGTKYSKQNVENAATA